MNIESENNMTIEFILSPPPLVRSVIRWDEFPYNSFPQVQIPALETQISADIPWDEFPYNRSFPQVQIPALETQISADIPWDEYPYYMSFPGTSKL